MTVDISNIFFLFAYESFIIFSSIRITYLITKKFQKKIPLAEIVIAWISIGLILNFITPSIFSFLQFNGIIQYLLFPFLILLILHIDKKSQLIIYKNYLAKILNSIFKKMFDWKIIVIVSALIPLILLAMRPFSDTDSMYFIDFMIKYIFNQITPYTSAHNYVPLWELSYLPYMILSNSDNFFWVHSFKPLIIIGLGTYLIGHEIKLPKNLIWISIFSSILFFKIWTVASGSVGSLKNDYIFAAGVLLIIFATIRSFRTDSDRLTYLFFSIGLVFVTIKSSGIALGLIAILVFIFINKNKILKNKKKITVCVFLTISFLLLTTGHYYLKNVVEYGNPFWPYKLGILDDYLPGTLDISSTSIFSNLENEDVHKVFFPTSKISIGGLYFPVLVIIGFVGSLVIITFMAIRYLKTRKIVPAILVISFFIFITWSLYILTPLTAGNTEGDLLYISRDELASSRYIIGTLFLTELFFVFILWKLKVPTPIIFSIVGINMILRYWTLLSYIPKYFDPWLVFYSVVFLIASFLFIRFSKKIIPNSVVIGSLAILILIFSPNVVDANRENWVLPWHDVVMYLHELPPSKIFLIHDGKENMERIYAISGSEFQHTIQVGGERSLINNLAKGMNEDAKPEYVVELCRYQYQKYCKLASIELESKLSEYNYEIVVEVDRAILLKNVN